MTEPTEGAKHETREVDYKKVVLSGALFFAVGFGTLAVARPIFEALAHATRQPELTTTPSAEVRAPNMLDPRVEMKAASGEEVRELRRREAETLSTYGWLDRARYVVHVPIERAMAAIAQNGLPARPALGSRSDKAVPSVDASPSRPAATSTAAPAGPSIPMGESNGFSEGGVP